uniref:Uncharacterized protein n=1 Tax=Rhizophora mucronata TaxID=61149 RepID=A0A2P2KBB4_RHIMU
MDIEQEGLKPLSPTGQWTSSSFLSLFVIGVLESQVPIDDTQIMPLIPNVFLPINTRFSSIMVRCSCRLVAYLKFVHRN